MTDHSRPEPVHETVPDVTHPEDAVVDAIVKARAERLGRQADVTVDTEAALRRVRARIADENRSALHVSRGGPSRAGDTASVRRAVVGRRWWIAGAAAAVFAAVVGISQWRATGDASAPVVASVAYQTAVGRTDTVRLSDGSTVVLAPGSELSLADGFGHGARTVSLRGAAFFEVTHDAARPFVVRVNGAEVRDLGTAFSIRTGISGTVSVAVTHGIVALRPAGSTQQAELRAGDHGVVSARTMTVRRGVVTEAEVAWTRGLMQYRDTPLDEVRGDVQRWYGLTMQIDDPALARRTLTATFRADSAAQAIRLIALAIGAEPVMRGDTVMLQPLDAPSGSGSARVR